MNKFYMTMATDVDDQTQSDELYLVNANGKIIGCSSEFEVCTFDIAKANSCVKCNEVEWFSWDDIDINTPATLKEIEQSGLLPYVIGYRNKWHCNEPIHPLEQEDL